MRLDLSFTDMQMTWNYPTTVMRVARNPFSAVAKKYLNPMLGPLDGHGQMTPCLPPLLELAWPHSATSAQLCIYKKRSANTCQAISSSTALRTCAVPGRQTPCESGEYYLDQTPIYEPWSKFRICSLVALV